MLNPATFSANGNIVNLENYESFFLTRTGYVIHKMSIISERIITLHRAFFLHLGRGKAGEEGILPKLEGYINGNNSKSR